MPDCYGMIVIFTSWYKPYSEIVRWKLPVQNPVNQCDIEISNEYVKMVQEMRN